MGDQEHTLAMSLRAAYLSMHRQTNLKVAPFGVTADQFVCLAILANEDSITQKELVSRATSDQNTMRAMLVLLENRQLIQRLPHPTDGRARLVILTPKGRELYRALINAVKPLHDALSSTLENQHDVLTTLGAITRSMQELPAQLVK